MQAKDSRLHHGPRHKPQGRCLGRVGKFHTLEEEHEATDKMLSMSRSIVSVDPSSICNGRVVRLKKLNRNVRASHCDCFQFCSSVQYVQQFSICFVHVAQENRHHLHTLGKIVVQGSATLGGRNGLAFKRLECRALSRSRSDCSGSGLKCAVGTGGRNGMRRINFFNFGDPSQTRLKCFLCGLVVLTFAVDIMSDVERDGAARKQWWCSAAQAKGA